MNKFFICVSNFCEERLLDCQKVFDYLVANGWNPVNNVSAADLVVVGTVFYLRQEDEISMSTIRYYAKRKLSSAKMFIIGCPPEALAGLSRQYANLITLSPTNLSLLDQVVHSRVKFDETNDPTRINNSQVIFNPLLKRVFLARLSFIQLLRETRLSYDFVKSSLCFIRNLFRYMFLVRSYIHPTMFNYGNNYVYLRVSQGCVSNCSYCAIKLFAGQLKSQPMDKILVSFRDNLLSGRRFFYLSSEDTGCYGLDIGMTSADLLEKIFSVGEEYEFKLLITNFNAQWFIKYYDKIKGLLVKNQHKIMFFQVPVQSGSNRILKLMNRPYCINDLERCLLDLKKVAPFLVITTDVIVGFPGETREDFNTTKSFLERVRLPFAAIFNYEDRTDTFASGLGGKISSKEAGERKLELLKIQNYFATNSVLIKKFIELIKELT